jgi:hypothetical protein
MAARTRDGWRYPGLLGLSFLHRWAIFSFNWVFDTTGPIRHVHQQCAGDLCEPTLIEDGDGFFFVDETKKAVALPVQLRLRGEGGGGPPVTLQISVVPIGGTLPLLLSALGALGWVARRRSKAAALPA